MKHTLRFFDDYGSGWLWPGDAAATEAFGAGPIESGQDHRLSVETRALAEDLLTLSAASLNQDDPPEGCTWPLAERLAFDASAHALLARLQAELGAQFTILNARQRLGP